MPTSKTQTGAPPTTGDLLTATGGALEADAPRKAAFGRTTLFLTGDDSVLERDIRTVSGAARRRDGAVYHDLARSAQYARRPVCCWHCCEPIDGGIDGALQIPKAYDAAVGVYHVYGFFRTFACAKAYILEQTGFDRGYQTGIFYRMAREVYGIRGEIVEAAPRVSLKRFGGPFDPPAAREEANALDSSAFNGSARLVSTVEPPFVSYCMLLEERHVALSLVDGLGAPTSAPPPMQEASIDCDAFVEPAPRARYDAFVTEMDAHEEVSQPASGDASSDRRAPPAARRGGHAETRRDPQGSTAQAGGAVDQGADADAGAGAGACRAPEEGHDDDGRDEAGPPTPAVVDGGASSVAPPTAAPRSVRPARKKKALARVEEGSSSSMGAAGRGETSTLRRFFKR